MVTDPPDGATRDPQDDLDALLEDGGSIATSGPAMEVPGVILELGSALDQHAGVVDQAVADDDALHIWAVASPEVRSAILFYLAWSARQARLPDGASMSTGGTYAIELLTYARHFPDDAAANNGLPGLPLPGQAGALATSLAFGRDELPVSLETALLLLSAHQSRQQQR